MQPLVKETGGSNLRNWTTLSLPGIRLLGGEQCELRDLWVTGKEDHGFLRCEEAVMPMWRRYKSAQEQDVFSHSSGMNTGKSRYTFYSLVPEVCTPQGICPHSITGAESCFVLFSAGL